MAKQFKDDTSVRFMIGDVHDRDRLYCALDGIDYVVHAATTKIVPTAEYVPFVCVKTNVLEAMNLIDEIDEIFQKSNQYLLKNLEVLNKYKLGSLLGIGLASPLHRTLIAAWRFSAQKVAGFVHGNNYGLAVNNHSIEPNYEIVKNYEF